MRDTKVAVPVTNVLLNILPLNLQPPGK